MESKCEEIQLEDFQEDVLKSRDNKSLLAVYINVNKAKYLKTQLENTFLLEKKSKPDILCLSGIEAKKNPPDFADYTKFYKPQNEKHKEICMYVKSNLSPEQINDEEFIFESDYSKQLWVNLPKTSVIIGLIYRWKCEEAKNLKEFQEQLFPLIGNLKEENKRFYILGNFSINFLPEPPYFSYKEELKCQSLIDKPTRISKTLKDHIYTSDTNGKSGVVQTDDICKNYPIYCSIPKDLRNKSTCAMFCKCVKEKFCNFGVGMALGFLLVIISNNLYYHLL